MERRVVLLSGIQDWHRSPDGCSPTAAASPISVGAARGLVDPVVAASSSTARPRPAASLPAGPRPLRRAPDQLLDQGERRPTSRPTAPASPARPFRAAELSRLLGTPTAELGAFEAAIIAAWSRHAAAEQAVKARRGPSYGINGGRRWRGPVPGRPRSSPSSACCWSSASATSAPPRPGAPTSAAPSQGQPRPSPADLLPADRVGRDGSRGTPPPGSSGTWSSPRPHRRFPWSPGSAGSSSPSGPSPPPTPARPGPPRRAGVGGGDGADGLDQPASPATTGNPPVGTEGAGTRRQRTRGAGVPRLPLPPALDQRGGRQRGHPLGGPRRRRRQKSVRRGVRGSGR